MTSKFIKSGTFIIEYCGEVIDSEELTNRLTVMNRAKPKPGHIQSSIHPHFYMLSLNSNETIDASNYGNISRFMNHSCDPNCSAQMWAIPEKSLIDGNEIIYKNKMGIFASRDILINEQITIDYKAERSSTEDEPCFCQSVNCRGSLIDKKENNKSDIKSSINKNDEQ